MKIAIFIFTAYVFSGIAQILQDLSGGSFNRPMWTYDPSLGKAIYAAVAWPLRLMRKIYISEQPFFTTALGVLSVFNQLAVLTLLIWGSHAVSGLVSKNVFINIPVTAILAGIGFFVFVPFAAIITNLIALIFSIAMAFVFPNKNR